MKALNKNLVLFMVIVMFAQLISFNYAEAAVEYSYTDQAQTLHDLGLYNGVSSTTFDPDLGTALNRETGVVMLLRLFGLEADALALTDAEADAALSEFSDAASISSWARLSVAYAVQNGLVSGLPDGTFAPNANLEGRAYSTMILRQLGYSVDAAGYNTAPSALEGIGGLTPEQAAVYSGQQQLIRDDLVGISFGSLSAAYINGGTVIEHLVIQQVVDPAAALNAGLMVPPAPQPPAAQPPTPPTPPAAQDPAPSNNNNGNDDDDDNDDIVGTGVTSTLSPIEQGSIEAKEINKLTILNGATTNGTLIFNMKDDQDTDVMCSVDNIKAEDDEMTVANAVYTAVANNSSLMEHYDVYLASGGVNIIFTAKTEVEDPEVDIELSEADYSAPTGVVSMVSEVKAVPISVDERVELFITNGAIRAGTLKLTIDEGFVNVIVQAGDIPELIAEKLIQGINMSSDPYFSNLIGVFDISQDGGLIIFEAWSPGDQVDLEITLE